MFHGYIKLQKGTSLSKVDTCKLDLWSTLHIFNDICFWDMMISWLYLKICYHMDLRTVPYGYVALISSNFDGTDAIEDQVNHQNPPFSGPSHIQIHSSVNVY